MREFYNLHPPLRNTEVDGTHSTDDAGGNTNVHVENVSKKRKVTFVEPQVSPKKRKQTGTSTLSRGGAMTTTTLGNRPLSRKQWVRPPEDEIDAHITKQIARCKRAIARRYWGIKELASLRAARRKMQQDDVIG